MPAARPREERNIYSGRVFNIDDARRRLMGLMHSLTGVGDVRERATDHHNKDNMSLPKVLPTSDRHHALVASSFALICTFPMALLFVARERVGAPDPMIMLCCYKKGTIQYLTIPTT